MNVCLSKASWNSIDYAKESGEALFIFFYIVTMYEMSEVQDIAIILMEKLQSGLVCLVQTAFFFLQFNF